MVRVCIVFGINNAIWASPETGFRIPNMKHEWFKREGTGDSSVSHGLEFPKEWTEGDRVFMYGFTGYDCEEARNMRAYIKGFEVKDQKVKLDLGTW